MLHEYHKYRMAKATFIETENRKDEQSRANRTIQQ